LFVTNDTEPRDGSDPSDTGFAEPDPDPELSGLTEELNSAQLSFHALSGVQSAQTIRVLGRVGSHQVRVLVDGGSTLNFIQAQAAHKLGLPHFPSPPLKVTVGNGEKLSSTQVYKEVQLEIQGHTFAVDLYALNLCGPDIVLGTPWLKTLGSIVMDYDSLTTKFSHADNNVELCGEIEPPPANISYNQLKRVISTDPTTQLFSISPVVSEPITTSSAIITHPNSLIASLLAKYATIFSEPIHLPPP
jgi:hypothetical protein